MKIKLKIFALFVSLISACQKEPLHETESQRDGATTTSLTLQDAKDYLAKLDTDSSTALSKLNLDWKLAKNESIEGGNKWIIHLEGQPIYQNYKQGYRQLVILRNRETQKIEAKILEIIPDAIYLQKNGISKASDFTGRVFVYNLNYRLREGRVFSDGKPVGRIKQFTEQEKIDQANKLIKDINPFRGSQQKLMKMMAIETCAWIQDYYIDAAGELTVHSTEICSTSYIDIGGGGGGGGTYDGVGGSGESSGPGGGGGGGGMISYPPPPPSNLPGENNNKIDPKKMMKCFSQITSPNAAFVVKVFVVEPLPGTSFNVGNNSFGHVAISLSKNSGSTTITQTIGFYPTGTGLEKLSSNSQVIDNGYDNYNMSATYYVDGTSFQKVIEFISNPQSNYHFTDYNCSAFVYGAGQAGGIPIPNPTTQIGIAGPGGAGYAMTPAGMASALRDQKANNPNLDIEEGGGTMPASKGECK